MSSSSDPKQLNRISRLSVGYSIPAILSIELLRKKLPVASERGLLGHESLETKGALVYMEQAKYMSRDPSDRRRVHN